MNGSKEIATLLAAVLEPARAGGLSDTRASEIYDEIMSSIANLGSSIEGKTAFETLRDDLLEKWAMHNLKTMNRPSD